MSSKTNIDLLTCGSAVSDIFANTTDHIVSVLKHGTKQEMRAYPVGSKIIIKELQQQIGGGGTNTAASIATLGLSTGFIGCIGEDIESQLVLDCLADFGVAFYGHRVSIQTGKSIVLDSTGHDRTILTYKGANNCFQFNAIKKQLPKAKGLYCSSMMGKSFTAQVQLCRWAKSQHMLVAYNPSSYQVKQGLQGLKALLSVIDVLIFNKEEAELLVGKKKTGKDYLLALHEYVPTVVITDGGHTCYAIHENEYYELHPTKSKIVETTGAGDAFASTLFVALVIGKSFAEGLLLALLNSQSVIKHYGAKNGLQTLPSLEKFIKQSKYQRCVRHHGTLI